MGQLHSHDAVPLCRRDKKGCSNGYYVLGYRIYVNGNYWQSVDGALTTKTSLLCAAISNLQHVVYIHIRCALLTLIPVESNYMLFLQNQIYVCRVNTIKNSDL